MYKHHNTCRACGNEDLKPAFEFDQPQPLANAFRAIDSPPVVTAPLTVLFCEKCTLAQLSVVVDPNILYANYPYQTSKSETMRLHFRALWDAIAEQSVAESVIEIGSNNGDFLAFARDNGAAFVAGIDPAENLAAIAIRRGIQTVIGILDDNTAACASRVIPQADVIVARHVFAHVDDWCQFIRNLDTLANRDTLIVIEVPYVVDTLERCEFDTAYHEHLSYVSINAIAALLDGTPFQLQKVMRFPIHGGSVAIFLRLKTSGITPDASVQKFLDAENITIQTWKKFSDSAKSKIEALKHHVNDLRASGRIACGYGASAKSTVWISACGFTRKDIAFIVDNTPQKQGKFSPGTDIPIVPESELSRADAAVNFAWVYAREIEEKNKAWPGVFINPHSP